MAEQISLNLHVTQPPAKMVSKWGAWGKDYNIIVIKVLLQFISKVEINNWQNITPSSLIIGGKEEGIYSLKAKNDDWSVAIDFKAITFQRCDIY